MFLCFVLIEISTLASELLYYTRALNQNYFSGSVPDAQRLSVPTFLYVDSPVAERWVCHHMDQVQTVDHD